MHRVRKATKSAIFLFLVQCSELAEKLAEDVTGEGLKGRTVTLKLKTTNFEVRTRAATLPRHISAYEDIFREAMRLLRAELPITIRLMVSQQRPHQFTINAPTVLSSALQQTLQHGFSDVHDSPPVLGFVQSILLLV